jgi:hypothetical protein
MSLLRERCSHSFWSGGQFALLRSARRSDSSYLGPSSAAEVNLSSRPTGDSGLAMWSLRFPAHYSWITGNPEVILRTPWKVGFFNFPCLGRQKRVDFPKTRLCYAGLVSPTI